MVVVVVYFIATVICSVVQEKVEVGNKLQRSFLKQNVCVCVI